LLFDSHRHCERLCSKIWYHEDFWQDFETFHDSLTIKHAIKPTIHIKDFLVRLCISRISSISSDSKSVKKRHQHEETTNRNHWTKNQQPSDREPPAFNGYEAQYNHNRDKIETTFSQCTFLLGLPTGNQQMIVELAILCGVEYFDFDRDSKEICPRQHQYDPTTAYLRGASKQSTHIY